MKIFKNIDELPLFLTIEDLADVLAVSKPIAYEFVHMGKIEYIKIGKQYRIPKNAIEELIA